MASYRPWTPPPGEVAVSIWETSALVELLERKGTLTKQEALDMTQELRRREHTPGILIRVVLVWLRDAIPGVSLAPAASR